MHTPPRPTTTRRYQDRWSHFFLPVRTSCPACPGLAATSWAACPYEKMAFDAKTGMQTPPRPTLTPPLLRFMIGDGGRICMIASGLSLMVRHVLVLLLAVNTPVSWSVLLPRVKATSSSACCCSKCAPCCCCCQTEQTRTRSRSPAKRAKTRQCLKIRGPSPRQTITQSRMSRFVHAAARSARARVARAPCRIGPRAGPRQSCAHFDLRLVRYANTSSRLSSARILPTSSHLIPC